MNDFDKFWIRMAEVVALFFVTLIGSCSVKDYYSEVNVIEAIKHGANPIAARCAIYGVEQKQILCHEAAKAAIAKADGK